MSTLVEVNRLCWVCRYMPVFNAAETTMLNTSLNLKQATEPYGLH